MKGQSITSPVVGTRERRSSSLNRIINDLNPTFGRLNDSLLGRDEVSHRRELRSSIEAKDIMAILADHFGVSTDDLIRARGDLRNATIYFIKKSTEMTNRQIWELFGHLSYSAISQVRRRLSQKVSKDKSLRKELEKLNKTMSRVNGLTPFYCWVTRKTSSMVVTPSSTFFAPS